MEKSPQLEFDFSKMPADVVATKEPLSDAEIEARLPVPAGYRVLIALPDIEETYQNSSIVKLAKDVNKDYILSIMGIVVDMGPTAYADEERFPTGPWCKVGDYVLFRMNSGTRIKVDGKEYRVMNDDSIEAIIPDPRGVTAA